MRLFNAVHANDFLYTLGIGSDASLSPMVLTRYKEACLHTRYQCLGRKSDIYELIDPSFHKDH